MIGKSVAEIASVLGQRSLMDVPVLHFAVDSRKVESGSMFFALRGEKVDGHDFLQEAKRLGAICAIVESTYVGDSYGLELIHVENPLEALQLLARVQAEGIRCIGITGSVGKTTTKEFLYTLLKDRFRVGKTPGNANSQTSIPLHLLCSDTECDLFIAEMGMSQKGEIASLVSIIPPQMAIVTQVALSHAVNFPGGIEEIAEAKAEILSHPATKKAFLHADVAARSAFQGKKDLSIVAYGDVAAGSFIQKVESGWVIFYEGKYTCSFTLPFEAKHLVHNFLGAALVAYELGMQWEEIFKAAQNLTSYQKRFEIIEKGGITFVNDSYNANPTSVRAALENMPQPKEGGQVIAALGTMGELGVFSEAAHREVGKVAALHADVLLCFGADTHYMAEEFSCFGKKVEQFSSFSLFKEAVLQTAKPGDVVLIKASNSLALWKILEDQTHGADSIH